MEHGVYICTWSRSPDGYVLWVKSRPHIRAVGLLDDAEERLIAAIHAAGGAIQAVLEFDPPLPKSALDEQYTNPELYLITGDDRFETDAPRWRYSETAKELNERLNWHDAYYEKPVCRKCKYTSGRRSDKLLTLKYSPSRIDGAFGSIGTDGGPNHQILSEEFVTLLTTEESRRLELRPTLRKGRRKFYELIGPVGVPIVAVAGLKVSGWRCTQCDHRVWGYWIDGMSISSFVAKADLQHFSMGLFTVGTPPEIQLAVTAARWRELVGQRGTRGFTSEPLGVVPDHEVVRQPELPTLEAAAR